MKVLDQTLMKKLFWIPVYLVLVVGCSTSERPNNEQTISDSFSGIHFQPNHGLNNQPINVIDYDNTFHLFYTTGSNEWGHATSNNLVHWTSASAISLPAKVDGDIFLDSFNITGLSMTNSPPWIKVFNHDEKLEMNYSVDLSEWTKIDLNYPNKIIGTPTISWYEATEQWILSVTNEDKVVLLTSANLEDWEIIDEINLPNKASKSFFRELNGLWMLLIQGEEDQYQIGEFDGKKFSPMSKFDNLPTGPSKLQSVPFSNQESTYLISATASGVFLLPRKLSYINDQLTGFPIDNIKNQVSAKRRSKLSALRGDKSSWFHFTLESIPKNLEILISNQSNELTYLVWNTELNDLLIDRTSSVLGEQGTKEHARLAVPSENIQMDVFIDKGIIEVYVNEGFSQATLVIPSQHIYDKVDLKVDGNYYDVPAIVYSLSEEPINQ